jgi:hypothetical protein
MNLREIDRLVATEVMRWKIFVSKNVDTGTVVEFYDDGENLIKVSEWFPTLDIQHAWQVVEKMKEARFSIRNRFVAELQREVTIIHQKCYYKYPTDQLPVKYKGTYRKMLLKYPFFNENQAYSL